MNWEGWVIHKMLIREDTLYGQGRDCQAGLWSAIPGNSTAMKAVCAHSE